MENLVNANPNFYGVCYGVNEEKGRDKLTKLTAVKAGQPLYEEHLNKQTKIGVFPFVDSIRVGFGAIDIDDYKIDHRQIVKKLSELNVPGVTARSTNGGCHIYFFFKEPALAADVRSRLAGIATQLGYDGCEVFPKQNDFNPKPTKKGWKGLGNFIYLPGGFIRGMEDKSCFFDSEGNEIDAANAEGYMLAWKTDFKQLPRFGKTTTSQKPKTNSRPLLSAAPDISDYPPCLAALYIDGVRTGGRNNYMFNSAVMVKKAKGTVTEEDLKPFLAKLDGHFEDDLNIIIDQVNEGDYFYRCNEDPIKPLCDKAKCKTKKLGIGKERAVDIERYHYTYCMQVNGFVDNRNGEIYSASHTEKLIQAGFYYFDNKRITSTSGYLLCPETEKLARYGFNPTKPDRYYIDGILHANGYRKPPIEAVEGDIQPWLDLINNIIIDEEYRHPFHQFIASNIQRPGLKIKWCPLVIGRQGIGKDLIFEGMRPSLGKDYVADIDMALIKQDHTGHFDRKLFAILSETRETGRTKAHVTETLKKLITDTRLKLRKMNMDAFWIDNVMNFMFFSNYKTALTLDEDARRFMVIINENPRREPEFYAPIWDLVTNNPGIIYNYYMNYDLTGFNIASAPQTKYLKEVAKLTDMPAGQYLDFLLEECVWPFQEDNPYVSIHHLAEALALKKTRPASQCDPTAIKWWLQRKEKQNQAMQCCRIDWKDSKTMIWSLSPETHNETNPTKLRDCYRQPTEPVSFLSWYAHKNPPF